MKKSTVKMQIKKREIFELYDVDNKATKACSVFLIGLPAANGEDIFHPKS